MGETEFYEGLYEHLYHKEYHALKQYISSSYLVQLDKVPAKAKVEPKEDAAESYALTFGSAFHCLLLEGPQAFERDYAYKPNMDIRTKEGKLVMGEWNALNSHKTALRGDSREDIEGMVGSVWKHPFAVRLLTQGRSEISIFWQDPATKIRCKCRPDRIPAGDHGTMVSLKSTSDASYEAFQRSIIKFSYDIREAMYCEGFNAVCNSKIDATVFICVEKTPPYRVECYTIEDAWLEYGRQEFHRLLEIEKQCREAGEWKHYRNEGITEIEMPMWFRGR